MATKETGGKNSPTAKRLRLLMKVENYKLSSAFADRLGITPSRLSNMMGGSSLSIDVAQKIVAKVPGMSLDWLYNGKEDALPVALRQRLAEGAENASTTSGRSKGG